VLDVNLKGSFLVAQAVTRKMVADGTKGAIVNISSSSVRGHVLGVHYSASKNGIIGSRARWRWRSQHGLSRFVRIGLGHRHHRLRSVGGCNRRGCCRRRTAESADTVVAEAIKHWLKQHVRPDVRETVEKYVGRVGRKPRSIRVAEFKNRLGVMRCKRDDKSRLAFDICPQASA